MSAEVRKELEMASTGQRRDNLDISKICIYVKYKFQWIEINQFSLKKKTKKTMDLLEYAHPSKKTNQNLKPSLIILGGSIELRPYSEK